MLKVHVALAAAMFGVSAVPAAASPTEPVSGSVQVDDLDLTARAGIERFEGRVRSEARTLCDGGARMSLRMAQLVSRCEAEVLASAREQLPRLVTQARNRSGRVSA